MNGDEARLRDNLRKHFAKVMFVKPNASRSESREIYLLATGFKK
jgi:23S rRNA U2552 (ribose-2'-O)-methylase RlmE/FtsJ